MLETLSLICRAILDLKTFSICHWFFHAIIIKMIIRISDALSNLAMQCDTWTKCKSLNSYPYIARHTRETSSDELFSKEEMENKRMEILWTDTSTVHVTITFAQRSPWSKEWFQKFIFGFYRSNILRVNKKESPSWRSQTLIIQFHEWFHNPLVNRSKALLVMIRKP